MSEILAYLRVKLLEDISFHPSCDVFFLYTDMADPKDDIATKALDCEETSFFEFMIEA